MVASVKPRVMMALISVVAFLQFAVTNFLISYQSMNLASQRHLLQSDIPNFKRTLTNSPDFETHAKVSSLSGVADRTQPKGYRNQTRTHQPCPHPHGGARDELGNWGYVHDPTILLKKPQQFKVLHNEEEDFCQEVGYGLEGGGASLAKRLFRKRIKIAKRSEMGSPPIKVFCAIYSYPGNNAQTDAIRRTWGRRCDGFMTASTETNHTLATIDLPHFGQYQGEYNGIWQKVRSIVSYIYDNFLDDYDFFFICGDDTYVIMENLKQFLTSPDFVEYAGGNDYPNMIYTGAITHPNYLKEKYGEEFYYMGGGSGYVINRSTVKALVEEVFPVCERDTDDSMEDLYMGWCLRNVLNVTGYDSRDANGGERFVSVDPVMRAALRPRKKREKKFAEPKKYFLRMQLRWQWRTLGWETQYFVQAISPGAISFHLAHPPAKMKRWERLFYRMSPTYSEEDCGVRGDTPNEPQSL
mmetsp:Transcript_14649/g.40714  ORF Transcript_14649/g.40714 Transcript_14649/m.40714 type:complete len:468 (-) Transcript_14649:580-1983(-)|eukprot:CAMPEP_0172372936 /NCGR_PEP_ID=MMETSP1060-20121228/49823_1 /TAXON_ID=37318 /ORGANISM="Pseudo-nitzschia pungens, Strain cf. cingulata" /LENGTH=467 /DNA_ID=CAMNT_0013099107 /DNA_START=89 /DNA_END=1492 /DNA_ORIENTATION=+